MGKLRNFHKAHLSEVKLKAYCLNEFHPYGKEKAAVFKSVLSMTINDSTALKAAILRGIAENECLERGKDQYGERFTVIMKISNFDKEADVTTGWIIRTGEDFPRMTSCYIRRRKKYS